MTSSAPLPTLDLPDEILDSALAPSAASPPTASSSGSPATAGGPQTADVAPQGGPGARRAQKTALLDKIAELEADVERGWRTDIDGQDIARWRSEVEEKL
jgi:hypothetical protein